MREKIARSLYEKASAERDAFIDERELDARKSWPWDKLSKRNIDYWEAVASQILSLIREEIEKAENPKWKGDLYCQLASVSCIPKQSNYYQGCHDMKQKILSLLRSKE